MSILFTCVTDVVHELLVLDGAFKSVKRDVVFISVRDAVEAAVHLIQNPLPPPADQNVAVVS